MLCQNCNKNEATTHIKQIINGESTEKHLCQECVKSSGYDDFFDSFSFKIPNIFSSFFSDMPFALTSAKTLRCENCGSSFEDIIKSGIVGCSKCYSTFYDKLLPSIQRIHGRATHAGKTPIMHETIEEQPIKSKEDVIKEKETELQKAVIDQNFELAAVLRDEIKALKEEN